MSAGRVKHRPRPTPLRSGGTGVTLMNACDRVVVVKILKSAGADAFPHFGH
jgi:hypothetical protein